MGCVVYEIWVHEFQQLYLNEIICFGLKLSIGRFDSNLLIIWTFLLNHASDCFSLSHYCTYKLFLMGKAIFCCILFISFLAFSNFHIFTMMEFFMLTQTTRKSEWFFIIFTFKSYFHEQIESEYLDFVWLKKPCYIAYIVYHFHYCDRIFYAYLNHLKKWMIFHNCHN